ncbi:MAG: hypothetical protein ABJD11_18075 [Gemmatimonadota bacterium]
MMERTEDEALSPAFLERAREWAGGKWWTWRLLLLLLLAWNGWRVFADEEYSGLFGGITFGVHEFGHMVFGFFGEFVMVAGGSIAQVLVPVLAGVLMLRAPDYFGLAAAGAWLSSSLVNLGAYVGDARALELPLLGMGPDPQHDWAFLLGHLHLLQYDTRFASALRLAAAVILMLSLAFGLWLCRQMATSLSADS